MISQRAIRIASIANELYINEVQRLREAGLLKDLLVRAKKIFDPIGGTYDELEENVKKLINEIKPLSEAFVKSAYRIPVGREFSPSSLAKGSLKNVQSIFAKLIEGIDETLNDQNLKLKRIHDQQSSTENKKQIEKLALLKSSLSEDITDLKSLKKDTANLSREINGKASKAKRTIEEYKKKKGGFYNEKEVDKILGGIFGFLLANLLESAILDQK